MKNSDILKLKVMTSAGSYVATAAIPEDVFNRDFAQDWTELQVTVEHLMG